MDETTISRLNEIVPALRALRVSVERSLQTGIAAGTGRLAARSYAQLQAAAASALPDDFYIGSLALELADNFTDEVIAAQVQFVASQLLLYLEDKLKATRSGRPGRRFDVDELRSIGRDFQDQIINMTRTTLRRALNDMDIDIDVQIPVPPVPPVPPRPGASYRDANLANGDFSGQRFDAASFRDANAEGANFSGASLIGADMKRVNMEQAVFDGATLEGANGYEGNFERASFNEVRATGINLKHANLGDASFRKAHLEGANFVDANLSSADFTEAHAVGVNFRNANLDGATFTDARLSGANFRDANLDNAVMDGATLSGAVMPDGAIYIQGMDLSRYGIVRDHDDSAQDR
jgi:uncharacterized protein YjbI with pentapeptide repeats